jgi:hypothetical protein
LAGTGRFIISETSLRAPLKIRVSRAAYYPQIIAHNVNKLQGHLFFDAALGGFCG